MDDRDERPTAAEIRAELTPEADALDELRETAGAVADRLRGLTREAEAIAALADVGRPSEGATRPEVIRWAKAVHDAAPAARRFRRLLRAVETLADTEHPDPRTSSRRPMNRHTANSSNGHDLRADTDAPDKPESDPNE